MDVRRSTALRNSILVLPIIAVASYLGANHLVPKAGGPASAANLGQELVWTCRTSFEPGAAVLDTPHFAIAIPSVSTTPRAGSGMVTFTVSSPQKVKSDLSSGGAGFDIRYATRVCTVSLGPQSFKIVDAKSLVIGGKTIPLTGPKIYITIARGGRFTTDSAAPKWYAAAYRRSFWSSGTQVAEKLQDIHPILVSPAGSIWPGRALTGPGIIAIDCARFAFGVQLKNAQTHTTGFHPFVSYLDVKVAGPDNMTVFANGIREEYERGVAAFIVAGVNLKIVDRGERLILLPSKSIALKGDKKYVTIAPDGVVSIDTHKPKWFAAFDQAPADPPHMTYTVSAE